MAIHSSLGNSNSMELVNEIYESLSRLQGRESIKGFGYSLHHPV